MIKCSRCKSGIARDRYKKIDGKIVCLHCVKHGNKKKGKTRPKTEMELKHIEQMRNWDLLIKAKKELKHGIR